jgi:2-polyprenyl-6-methoxyphenol hydroxylase-like FAD-dependent oxidoreductase
MNPDMSPGVNPGMTPGMNPGMNPGRRHAPGADPDKIPDADPHSALPVVVVGAGPVGLTSALLLARWGVPTVVLEASAGRDPVGSKAICFQRDVLDIFDRVGCAEPMVAEGVTWTTGRTYYREHELITVTFPDPGRSVQPPWINISQASVEGYLLERAAAEPLIDLRYNNRVVGLVQERDVEAQAVEAVVDGGLRVRGSHLVGADGPRSAVRRLLGIEFPGQTFDDRFLICDIRADLPFPSERRFFFDPEWNPGRQVLVHHCPDRIWRIDWQVPADYNLDAERESGALDARIRKIVGERPYEIVWATVYRFHERCAATFRRDRALLAGDAAHLYAPFGARGLNSGIQDAENLAWKLAFARRGWSPESVLDTYDLERRAAAAENLRVTTATMEFLVPQTDAQRAHRIDTLRRAVTDDSARPLIDSGRLAEPHWYLDSPLTTPPGARTHPRAGRPDRSTDLPSAPGAPRPPVPGVLCPDGPCTAGGTRTRLRRLFGGGLVALTASRQRAELAARVAAEAIAAPVTAYALEDIDSDGVIGPALRATAGSVHLVRPDGHLAAVLAGLDAAALPAQLAAALRRAVGR